MWSLMAMSQSEERMEPATIVVFAITAAFLGFCIWIERHSRKQERSTVFAVGG